MIRRIETEIDVSNSLALGESVHIAATIVMPDPALLPERPVVCFAKPGGGYSRGYYTEELPGAGQGDQAGFHASRGWIVVAMDNLGSGDSSVLAPELLNFTNCTNAAAAAEQDILLRLANGILAPDIAPVLQPLRIGMGQSTGGSLAIIQQVRHDSYDGLAILGFSAVHNHPATAPGTRQVVTPWFARDVLPASPGGVVNARALSRAAARAEPDSAWASLAWSFHFDDVPAEVVEQDLAHYEAIVAAGGKPRAPRPAGSDAAPWNSYTTPHEAARYTLTPGIIAPEAAAITVPVLAAMGERDLIVDPLGESRAYRSAASFDLFVCPRMGHMHNFGGTRQLFWERIHHFGEWCRAARESGALA